MRIAWNREAQRQHLNYIQRESAVCEKYGTNTPDELKKYKNNESYQFRFIISPSKQDTLTQDFMKAYVERIKNILGTDFEWTACRHNNTDQDHVHLVIRGVDVQGNKIRINYQQLAEIRRESSSVLTEMYGYAPYEQIQKNREGLYKSNVYIKSDEKLFSLFEGNNYLSKDSLKALDERNRLLIDRRLAHFVSMGFMKFDKGYYWKQDNLEETLKTNRKYETFLTAQKELKYTEAFNFFEYKKESNKTIKGIVTKKGLINEMSDSSFAVIETLEGEGYYVPLPFDSKLSTGDFVSIIPKGTDISRKIQVKKLDFTETKALYYSLKAAGKIRGFGSTFEQGLNHNNHTFI